MIKLCTLLICLYLPLNAFANNITLNIRDGQVRDVLGSIAALSGKSIVADSSVQGTITLDLKDVPFDTALRIITSAKGLSYRLTDGVVLVGSAAGQNLTIQPALLNLTTPKLKKSNRRLHRSSAQAAK